MATCLFQPVLQVAGVELKALRGRVEQAVVLAVAIGGAHPDALVAELGPGQNGLRSVANESLSVVADVGERPRCAAAHVPRQCEYDVTHRLRVEQWLDCRLLQVNLGEAGAGRAVVVGPRFEEGARRQHDIGILCHLGDRRRDVNVERQLRQSVAPAGRSGRRHVEVAIPADRNLDGIGAALQYRICNLVSVTTSAAGNWSVWWSSRLGFALLALVASSSTTGGIALYSGYSW